MLSLFVLAVCMSLELYFPLADFCLHNKTVDDMFILVCRFVVFAVLCSFDHFCFRFRFFLFMQNDIAVFRCRFC